MQLCEMFRCDMDTLIRGDATESFAEDNAQYDQHKNEFSKAVAFGVGECCSCGDWTDTVRRDL